MEATLTGHCGSRSIRRDVWIGHPSAPQDICIFPYNGKRFPANSFLTFNTWVQPIEQSVNTFEWNLSGATILNGQATSQIDILTHEATFGDINFTVKVRAGNSCGWGPWLARTGFIYHSGLPGSVKMSSAISPEPTRTIYHGGEGGKSAFSIYPNPATTIVAVRVNETSNIKERPVNETSILSLKIFDKMGQLVLTGHYPDKPK